VLHDLDYLMEVARIEMKFPVSFYSRGEVMNLNEANSLPAVAISGVLILGSIGFLIFWALQTAYVG
jgi:hypothetical protein